ncbi:AAA family ATPase [Endozoicomonas lisbonensis]|uniref:ATP-binding protein involved in virulence n=1 Tax=Endozoicomonas lisbonensis TaxID=3120522 RepID=A0ABV2SNI3_9GAMM
MKLKKIELTNFRAFDSLSLELEPDFTVLVAWNGQGKTSVLDGLARGLGPFLTRLPKISGIRTKNTDLKLDEAGKLRPYLRIALETTSGIEWDITDRRDKTKKTTETIPSAKGVKALNEWVDSFIDSENDDSPYSLPVIAYYGTGRGVFDNIPEPKLSFHKTGSRFEAFSGSLNSRVNFKQFFERFFNLEDEERRAMEKHRDFDYCLPALEAIRQAISGNGKREGLLPEFSNPRTQTNPADFLVDWKKPDGHTETLSILQLSDGFRTTLAMVMDIASRMATANPEADDILATPGVVMIDEIDLHLHPDWQQRILPDLHRTFPNVQWIVSTHSPQIVSTVASEKLRIINNGQLYSAAPGTQGAEASRILKRIFGVEQRPQNDPNTILLNQYLDLVYADQWNTPEAIDKRQQLDAVFQGEESALTEADLHIENRQWELDGEEDR